MHLPTEHRNVLANIHYYVSFALMEPIIVLDAKVQLWRQVGDGGQVSNLYRSRMFDPLICSQVLFSPMVNLTSF